MKLSTLINKAKARSLTVHIHKHYTVVEAFFFAQTKPTVKVYKKLDSDTANEGTNQNCKQLGITRERYYKNLRFYANVYNYPTHISEFNN